MLARLAPGTAVTITLSLIPPLRMKANHDPVWNLSPHHCAEDPAVKAKGM